MVSVMSLCGCGSGRSDKKDRPAPKESREEQAVENDWSKPSVGEDTEKKKDKEKKQRPDKITYTYQCHPIK